MKEPLFITDQRKMNGRTKPLAQQLAEQRAERNESIAKAYDDGVGTMENAERHNTSPATIYSVVSQLRWNGGPSPYVRVRSSKRAKVVDHETAPKVSLSAAEKRLIGAKANVIMCEADLLETKAKALRDEAEAMLRKIGVRIEP